MSTRLLCPPQPASSSSPPHPAQTTLRECDYKQLISALDTNKDGQVDFVEYMRLLGLPLHLLP